MAERIDCGNPMCLGCAEARGEPIQLYSVEELAKIAAPTRSNVMTKAELQAAIDAYISDTSKPDSETIATLYELAIYMRGSAAALEPNDA